MTSRALVGLALLMVAAGQAQARVDLSGAGEIPGPKPNILILLDTSGSMSGLAGVPFGPASEVGMDCEHGENCRPGSVGGACRASKRPCRSSEDCRSGFCALDDRTLCTQDSDCPQALGTCSESGGSCTGDADCPQPRCPTDPAVGTCSHDGRQACQAERDCPTSMRCQVSGDLCREDNDCPLFQTTVCDAGARAGRACQRDVDCPAGRCATAPANPCKGTLTRCQLSGQPCLANSCVPALANTCRKPVHAGDVCLPATSGAAGPIRMCQGSHKPCNQDGDCGEGDTCGPATSRAMIVKRALGRLVMDNHELANFGLMTFFQRGYFPYVSTDAALSGTAEIFLDRAVLQRLGCYYWDRRAGMGGPSISCNLEGRQVILRATADSRYRVPGRGEGTLETNFCGESCELPQQRGTGDYLGSTYLVRRTASSAGAAVALVRDGYDGHDITVGGRSYAYFTPRNDYHSGGPPPPISGADCRDSCSPVCGGRWDARLTPFLDTSGDPDKAWAVARAINARMDRAAHGGLVSFGGAPTGCALDNEASPTPFSSAYHYMAAVRKGIRHSDLAIAPDPAACREGFVWLLTDGAPNGPGDVDGAGKNSCAAPACAADDPVAAGCPCRSVLAAYRMHRELGMTVSVFGFSVDASRGEAASAHHNVAKAGGAGRAFLVSRPDELAQALQRALGQAAGRRERLPMALPSADGKRIVTARSELPGWQGNLSVYAVGRPPSLSWDARAHLASAEAWKQRRIYTWTGSKVLKIQVDEASGTIRNKVELAAVGMGANADEAERVARWVLGDPEAGHPARLGATLSSWPAEVAAPPDSSLPGGHAHFLRHAKRPNLVVVGTSDQMVHAFVARDTEVRGVRLAAGSEAFAFIPPDLLPHVRQLWLQGGQEANPSRLVPGVSGAPRVLELCVAGCSDEKTARWKTLLVVSEGAGGPHAFALDVTDPWSGPEPSFAVAWHTGYGVARRAPSPVWKDSVAAPALFFSPSHELDDYQLVSASGFGISGQQRPSVSALWARDGSVAWSKPLAPHIACVQEYAVVTDVAIAHGGARDELTVAGYFGDTAGQLWRLTPAGGLDVLADLSCDHPLHFSPTVVQHVAPDETPGAERDLYLIQVTNSHRDPATARWPASQIVFLKQVIDRDRYGRASGTRADLRWGKSGRITLPMSGRPLGKPVAYPFARGFRVATLWQASASSACEGGRVTLTLHQVEADKVTQVLRVPIKSRNPAPSPLMMGGRLLVFDASGTFEEIAVD